MAIVGSWWPLLAFVSLSLGYIGLLLGLVGLLLGLVGLLLGFVGLCWPFVGLRWPILACVSCRGPVVRVVVVVKEVVRAYS